MKFWVWPLLISCLFTMLSSKNVLGEGGEMNEKWVPLDWMASAVWEYVIMNEIWILILCYKVFHINHRGFCIAKYKFASILFEHYRNVWSRTSSNPAPAMFQKSSAHILLFHFETSRVQSSKCTRCICLGQCWSCATESDRFTSSPYSPLHFDIHQVLHSKSRNTSASSSIRLFCVKWPTFVQGKRNVFTLKNEISRNSAWHSAHTSMR